MRDSLSAVYDGQARLTTLAVSSDRDVVIAVIRKHILCGQPNGPRKMVNSYQFVSGPDSTTIVRRLERDVETSVMKDLKGFDIIQLIKLKVKDMIVPPGSKLNLPTQMVTVGVRGL